MDQCKMPVSVNNGAIKTPVQIIIGSPAIFIMKKQLFWCILVYIPGYSNRKFLDKKHKGGIAAPFPHTYTHFPEEFKYL